MIDCCICVIQNDDKRILISQRREDDSFGGHWEFPGGKQEEGESREECAIREAHEEVGLEIEPTQFIQTVYNPYRTTEVNLHFFLCRIIKGLPEPKECQQVKWVKTEELRGYLFPSANEPIIQFLLKNNAIHSLD